MSEENVSTVETTETTTENQTTGGTTSAPSDPVTSETTKEAAREAIRKHKIKVAGQEIEVDDEELKKGYTYGKAANKTMQEAVRMRKQAEQLITMAKDKTQLFHMLKQLGHDPRQLSEEYLASELEQELLDPKDRELKATKTELDKYREKEEADKKAQEQKRADALKQKYAKEYEEQFVKALQEAKLPAEKKSVARMAGYIKRAAEIEIKMTPQEAALLVKQDINNELKSIATGADPETLIQIFGEEVANKIRQWDTSRVKDPTKGLENPTHANPQREKRDSTKRMTPQQWREYNRGR